ncbi:MAG: DNA-binding protein [Micromonosporaceae bacterium]|nr:DNA-binding protein [Micromonosporaceae bacterium]
MTLPGAPRSTEAAEFWNALGGGDGTLLRQECVQCGRSRLPRTAMCPYCGGWESHWRPVTGPARLVTFTVIRRAPSPEWAAHAPYGVAIVEVAPGCRVLVNTDWLPEHADLGRPVVVAVETGDGGPRLVASRGGDEAVSQ